jgi:hypothetical protein
MSDYQPPAFKRNSFNCPRCGALAHQFWEPLFRHKILKGSPVAGRMIAIDKSTHEATDDYMISRCFSCNRESSWVNKWLVDPTPTDAIPAHKDIPENIAADFEEARQIFKKSPRGAAALLRLCIQKLCKNLGLKGDNLNEDIGKLVALGLPQNVINAFDIVRVIGNEAVHPGVIDVRDDHELVQRLFTLVNLIIEKTIHEPKAIKQLYEGLPPEKLKGIEDRNDKAARPPKPQAKK